MRTKHRRKWIFCLWGAVCALWLVSCGGESAFPQPEKESPENTLQPEKESPKNTLQPEKESPENTPQPETSVRENPYEHTIFELLDGESAEEYLQDYGVEDVSPVYFYNLEGEPKLELYFDGGTGRGCGLKYEETEAGIDLLGFELAGYDKSAGASYWDYTNPYTTKIQYDDGALHVDRVPYVLRKYYPILKFEEFYEYDEDGRLCAYHLGGEMQTEDGGSEKEEIFTVFFYYRKEGSLREKVYQYNEEYFQYVAVGGERSDVYDERERLLYVETEYEKDYYFIYEEDAMIPTAYLELYPRYLDFVRLEDKDYDNRADIPRDGVEAFLRQVGLSPQDKFYEYQWRNESSSENVWSHSDIILTLYYDPERELGCGYFDYPGESLEDMSGFMFKGCVEIDCREKDPYGVYAEYNLSEHYRLDEVDIYHGMSPEELPQAYEYESQYVCEYDGGRLMRIWMYGTGSSNERFFIYDGDSDVPSYCLNLVSGVFAGATLFKFIY